METPYGTTLFCDDVRYEQAGKVSYIGSYGGDIRVYADKPAILPKLCAVVQLLIPIDFKYEKFSIVLTKYTFDTQEKITELIKDYLPVDGASGACAKVVFHMVMSPFQLEDDCHLRVSAYFDDAEIKLGSIPIIFTSPSESINTPAGR